jgi:proteic killer suppression protein
MTITFKSNKLQKQLTIAKEIQKAFGVNAKRVAKRMDELQAADNLLILQSIPAANCHPLSGNRNGEWAVDISANHRLIFEIENDPIPVKDDGGINTILVTDIKIIEAQEDYH